MMKNKIMIIGITLSFLIPSSIANISLGTSSNNIIYVDDDGGADYTKIQDAIDNASDGDTVFVYSGDYYETLILNKSILLKGENKHSTIIDGRYVQNHSYGITLAVYSYNSNSEISGFTIQNFDYAVIKRAPLGGSLYIKITDNVIINNKYGIKTSTTIGGSHIGLEISENKIENNEYGIYLNCIRSLSIKGNNITSNSEIGVFVEGYFCKIIQNNIYNNGEDAYNNAGFFHYWNNNFWGEDVKIIRTIPGKFINIDWNPSNEPYYISC
jgi:nitrous oxidase accessory protein